MVTHGPAGPRPVIVVLRLGTGQGRDASEIRLPVNWSAHREWLASVL